MHFFHLEVIFNPLIFKKNTFGTNGFEILTQALLSSVLVRLGASGARAPAKILRLMPDTLHDNGMGLKF